MQTATAGRDDKVRRERIETLVMHEQTDLLEQAAARHGLPLADFVAEILGRAATEETGTDVVISLSPEDSIIVADAFLNPPDPTPALRHE